MGTTETDNDRAAFSHASRVPRLLPSLSSAIINMDACNAVEEEVDKILLKFTGIKEHADRVLSDITTHVESLKKEMDECKH